jgi:mono/diheme cytochrome c family protein
MGCVTCHGLEGQGNISNPNYVKETVPKLNTLAEKMMLYEKEDINKIIDYLERDVKLETLEEEPVPRFNSVLAQYNSIKDVIKKGSKAGKLDSNGPEPPLNMPLWATLLSDEDIDAIIAYLLSIYPFEEEAK